MNITNRQNKESARDYALRIIREKIISLNLSPGSMVSENELSIKLGLSRTPVREALIELSKSKVVEVYPQKGIYISLIDTALVEEDRFLRLVLEKAIVKMACQAASEEDLLSLEANLNLQDFYLQNSAPNELLKLDDEFHQMLFLICKKSRIYALMNSMTIHFDRVRSLSLVTIKDIKIVHDHREIVDAIRRKDQEAAEAIMTKHLSRYKVDDELLRAKYSQYYKYE
jgi:DNA-binding GntR family transcriptional regulator